MPTVMQDGGEDGTGNGLITGNGPAANHPTDAIGNGVPNLQHATDLSTQVHAHGAANGYGVEEKLNGAENTQNVTSNNPNDQSATENDRAATTTQQNTTTTASTKAEIVDAASLKNIVLRRNIPAESMEDELSVVHSMWEMAAVFDFFNLFRQELKLTRSFGVEELEHVLITSPGDGGLLADVHVDLMRGISPKNEVTVANWQVHLANKIKFHWRNLYDGTPCPFKPDKYLEALEYAELPTPYRVKALHFLCCIRADREDIQARMAEAEREKFPEEIAVAEAALEAARQKSLRGTRAALSLSKEESYLLNRAAANKGPLETVDDFRREPTGIDSHGTCFYYFPQIDGPDANPAKFRLYQDIPAEKIDDETKDKLQSIEAANEAAAAHERELREAKMSKKRRERALRKMPLVKADLELCDPPSQGSWSLVASNIEELIEVGEVLTAGNENEKGKEKEKERGVKEEPEAEDAMDDSIALGRLILDQIVPQIKESLEAEQRRQRAAERVRSKLGGISGVSRHGSYGTSFPTEGGVGVAGRSRRERRTVNYAFPDYDDVLKSAIRGKKRSVSPDEVQGSRRSLRGGVSYRSMVDGTGADARLRRGRSAVSEADQEQNMSYLDERALRMAARARQVEKEEAERPSSVGQQQEEFVSVEDRQMEGHEQRQEDMAEVGELGEGRRRKKRRPAGDFVYYDDNEDIDDGGGRGSRAGAARRAAKSHGPEQEPGLTQSLIEQQQRMNVDLIRAMTGKHGMSQFPSATVPPGYTIPDHIAPPSNSSVVCSGMNIQPMALPDHQRYAAALQALQRGVMLQQQQHLQQYPQYQQYHPFPQYRPQFQAQFQQQYQNQLYSRDAIGQHPLVSTLYPPRGPPVSDSGRPPFFQDQFAAASDNRDGNNAGNVSSAIDGAAYTVPQRREG